MADVERETTAPADAKRIDLPPMTVTEGHGPPLIPRRHLDLVRDVRVRLSALLGETEITVAQLFDLKQGEVIPLLRGLDESVELQLDGKTVATGEIVVVGDQFGLRITEVPET